MSLILDNARQDRLIIELYAWVCRDPKTTLESLCGVKIGDEPFQTVTPSKATALKMQPLIEQIEAQTQSGKKFRLVTFVKSEVLVEL